MIRNDKLLRRLEGKRVCWHASCLESARPEYAFADLLVGHDMAAPCIKPPEVFVHTDHRCGLGDEFVFPWDDRTYTSENPDAEIKAVNVHRVADLGTLDGYSGTLGRDFGHTFDNPEFGHAVECRVTLLLSDDSTITRTVIFVCTETVEFALKFLIPNEIRVATFWQRGYHAGFNCCNTDGTILRLLAASLGTRWYYDGMDRRSINYAIQVQDPNNCVTEAFPELKWIAPVALARVPELDCRIGDGCETEEAWIVGQTRESAIHTARILGVQAED